VVRVAENLIAVVRDPVCGAGIAGRGNETALRYSYEAFRSAWIAELRRALRV
jgi:hypothetical protein